MSVPVSPIQSNPLLVEMRKAVEADLRQTIRVEFGELYTPMREMLEYHMGWQANEGAGKRLRPLFVLLAARSAGGDWQKAVPAAVAVELIHNFSLIHDDIQDQSELRHHRPTLWTKVGVPQAINAGDAMFTIGLKKIWELEKDFPPETTAKCSLLLMQTCLALTRGQYLDIDFEKRATVQADDYLEMIAGKTTSLIAASLQIGAILGSSDPQVELVFAEYGRNLGMAFQIVDDYLGIWGTADITGKSASSDLICRKKSYPILLGLAEDPKFKVLWSKDPVTEEAAHSLAALLADSGIQAETIAKADEYTQNAIRTLHKVCPNPNNRELLETLTISLLNRSN
jgi:geranylgeranyl diphosphate synthase, type I